MKFDYSRLMPTVANVLKIGGMMGLYAGEATFAKRRLTDPDDLLRYYTKNVSKWSARALKNMNVEIEVVGFNARLMGEKNFLIVSNHMSYTDIMILASVLPSVFVTSVDMQETPFLGPMAAMGGSIFIERRNRGQIDRDISAMSRALEAGHNVVIYPEGTSTNGQQILPFKKSLLMSAVDSGRDILPVSLKYVESDGRPFDAEVAEKICWYGDMTFLPHFLGIMGLKNLKVRLEFLEPIPVTKTSTRAEMADRAFTAIFKSYMGREPTDKEAGRPEEGLRRQTAPSPTSPPEAN